MDTMTPEKISIIVPVYNAEKYIEKTMDSVLAQTYKKWELLLVLDGCTDSSQKIIESYKTRHKEGRIRLIRQANQGAAQARNRGVMEADGRYIAYLDADDLWMPEKLEHQLTFMREKGAAFVFSGYEFADGGGRGLGKVVHVPPTLKYREALGNTTIFTSTVLFDTEKIPREFLQMPAVKSEDTALWWRLLRSGYTAYGLNENLVLYRRPGRSLSSNKLEAIRRIWHLYRKTEVLPVSTSVYYFCFWAVRAVKRRL